MISFDVFKERTSNGGKCSRINSALLAKVCIFLQECNSFEMKTTKSYRYVPLKQMKFFVCFQKIFLFCCETVYLLIYVFYVHLKK